MKKFIFLLLLVPQIAFGMSIPPCSEEQKSAYKQTSSLPALVAGFQMVNYLAAFGLAVKSIPKNNNPDQKSDDLPYWVFANFAPVMIAALNVPACRSMVIKEKEIQYEESEKNLKDNVSGVWLGSFIGQFVSLANTHDSDKRDMIKGIMGVSLVSQLAFQSFWTLKKPTEQTAVLPWQQKDAIGLQAVYTW